MVLRSVARHPAFLPLVAAFAVLVTAVVLHVGAPGERSAIVPDAAVSRSPADAGDTIAGMIERVQFARDGAPADRILVHSAGRDDRMWVNLRRDTRVLVPVENRQALGGPLDLAPGQQVEVQFALGADARGGLAARIAVAGPAEAATYD